jgi:hypothetical protein
MDKFLEVGAAMERNRIRGSFELKFINDLLAQMDVLMDKYETNPDLKEEMKACTQDIRNSLRMIVL